MSEPGHLGPYRLLHLLGRGGMGEVWEVTHRKAPLVHHALKTLGAGRHEASVLRGLLSEAKLGAMLQHPNIVRVLDAGVAGGRCYFVMELLEGRVLHQLRRPGEQLPLGAVASVAFEVLAALDYAQTLGVVHRDLKPSNVFMTETGEVKVIDFGVARAAMLDNTLTRTGAFRGTPAYASPEQIRAAPQDGRSDLYSLGVILRELLSGERAANAELLAARVLQPLAGRHPEVTPELDAVLMAACAEDPQARIASAAEFAARLRACLPERVGWGPAELARWVREAPPHESATDTRNETTSIELVGLVPAVTGVGGARTPAQSRVRGRWGSLLPVAFALAALALTGVWSLRARTLGVGQPEPAPGDAGVPLDGLVLRVDGPPPAEVSRGEPAVLAGPVPHRVRPLRRVRAPKAPTGAEEGAFLTVDARPVWAQVFVDGRALGPTPLVRVPLRPGRRHLRAVNADGAVSERELILGAGREERLLLTW